MPYKIEIVSDPGYILVNQSGNVDVGEMENIRKAVFKQVVEHGLSKVAVDVSNMTNEYTISEFFNITVENAAHKTDFPKPRVCLIVRKDQEENARFVENVGVNRGMPIKYFTDKEAALEWLLS